MSQIYKSMTSGSPIPPIIPTSFLTQDGNSSIPAANVEKLSGNNTANNGFATFTTTPSPGNQATINSYGLAKWVVNPILGLGTQTGIQAAITAASAGDTIFVTANSAPYVGDITMKAGVNIVAFTTDADPNVTIQGNVTTSYSGTASISGINFKTNGSNCLTVSGSNPTTLNLIDCAIDANNATAISINAPSSVIKFFRTIISSESNNALFSITATSGVDFSYCNLTGGTGASTISAGAVNFFNSKCQIFSLTTSSTGFFTAYNTFFDNSLGNQIIFTTAGSGSSNISECSLFSGTASAISIGSGTSVTINESPINSSNASVITGTGTLATAGLPMTGVSTQMDVTDQARQSIAPFLQVRSTLDQSPAIQAIGLFNTTSAPNTALQVYIRSTGTPGANFGSTITFYADNSVNAQTATGAVTGAWTTATSGSESSYMSMSAFNAANSIAPASLKIFPNYAQFSQGQVVNVTTPGAYPYLVLQTDFLILGDSTSAHTINLPLVPITGQQWVIKDATGTSNVNTITISGNGKNIDGVASKTITSSFGSLGIVYNGTQYNII